MKIYLSPDETDGNGGEEKIKIDDVEYTIDQIRDFRDSGLRQIDYTKKTQELSEAFKGIKEFEKILEISETDPDEALKMFQEALPHGRRTEKKRQERSERPDSRVEALESSLHDLKLKMAIKDVYSDENLGPALRAHETDILALAAEMKMTDIARATRLWVSESPEKAEKSRRPRGEDKDVLSTGLKVSVETDKSIREHVARGDIMAGFAAYTKNKP